MDKDFYKILGVNKNSSEEDIKMAYKRLAMKYHPDRNPNDPYAEEKFKEIKNAYESIINKNSKYQNNSFEDLNVNFDIMENINFTDFINTEDSLDDVFKVIFRNEFKRNVNTKIISTINIDLEQAVYGSFIYIKLPYQAICKKCFGKGLKIGSNIRVCSKCSGSGLYTMTQGLFVFRQKCFKCNGKGYISSNLCNLCKGLGKLNKTLICSTIIPERSDNNYSAPLYIVGRLEDDFSLENSYVTVKIKPHPIFIRKDNKSNDLYCKFIIDFIKSILGGIINIPTIYGYINYKIRQGIQSNEIYKIKEKGLNFTKSKKIGDLYIEIFIEIPLKLNIYQKFLIKKLKISIIENLNSYPLIINLHRMFEDFYNNIFII